MKPYYSENGIVIYNADCREALKALPSESVNCVVTSPPYFGLRDYGTAQWEGGSDDCQHTISASDADFKAVFSQRVTRGNRSACLDCGANRIDLQIGLEQTPESYVKALVDVFKEVRRVLRDDGTVWLNLGDSYTASATGTASQTSSRLEGGKSTQLEASKRPDKSGFGLAPKNLMMIPHRVAIALQQDGWYVRMDIVWHKPNPMPESVTDRPTKAHEYIFLLSKSQNYYYNADAIKEPVAESTISRGKVDFGGAKGRNYQPIKGDPNFRNGNEQWGRTFDYQESCKNGRNKRSVWTVATKPYPDSHFAVFPPELIKPCILAGCPVGGVVLDPFAGSGTTLQVAMEQGCKSVGIELNPSYCDLIKKRVRQNVFNFAEAI